MVYVFSCKNCFQEGIFFFFRQHLCFSACSRDTTVGHPSLLSGHVSVQSCQKALCHTQPLCFECIVGVFTVYCGCVVLVWAVSTCRSQTQWTNTAYKSPSPHHQSMEVQFLHCLRAQLISCRSCFMAVTYLEMSLQKGLFVDEARTFGTVQFILKYIIIS